MKNKIKVYIANYKDKIIVSRLIQFAKYDYSEFNNADLNNHGEYPYKYLNNYWTEKNRIPYLLNIDNKIGGFALLRSNVIFNNFPVNQIAEFLILKKYRNKGYGTLLANYLFNNHNGIWIIKQEIENTYAQIFWNKVINKFTKGSYYKSNEKDKEHPYIKFTI